MSNSEYDRICFSIFRIFWLQYWLRYSFKSRNTWNNIDNDTNTSGIIYRAHTQQSVFLPKAAADSALDASERRR